MQQEIILKKNIIGGFNRRQVTECLLQLKRDCTNGVSSEEIEAAKALIEAYTAALKEKSEQINLLTEQLNAASAPESDDRISVAKSISEAEQNIANAKIEADKIKIRTKNKIENNVSKMDTMFSKIHKISNETERIKSLLEEILIKLSHIQTKFDYEKSFDNKPIVDTVSETVSEAIQADIKKELPPEPESIIDIPEVVVTQLIEETQENVNSIDNFFNELYKMTNGKLFEPRKLAERPAEDSDDDFEYEY